MFSGTVLRKYDCSYHTSSKNNEEKFILPEIGTRKKIPKYRVVYKLPIDTFRVLKRIIFPNGLKLPEIICFSL